MNANFIELERIDNRKTLVNLCQVENITVDNVSGSVIWFGERDKIVVRETLEEISRLIAGPAYYNK